MGGIIATVKEQDGEILTVEIDPEKRNLYENSGLFCIYDS